MSSALIFAGFVLALGNPPAHAAGENVTVTTSRRVHPVLIRNEAGALLQIVVDIPRGKDVRLQALHFSLDGADDVESLSLFLTGDNNEFATTTRFGKPIDAAKTVSFHGELMLRPGKNVAWLSCRLKPTADLAHKLKAVCTSVDTTPGKHPVKDLNPQIRQRIGVALRKHKDDGVHTYRIPALTTTPKGTLLCVYDMRRRMGRDLQEDIDIGLSRSTDGGQTWEPVRVIMDMGKYGGLPEEQNGCSDPGIIVDHKTGEIFCFAVWMNGNPGKHQWTGDGSAPGYEIGKAAQILMVSSKDDGRTWTKPINLTRKLKPAEWWLFAPSPQSGINLPDGTLVMPGQGRDAKGIEFSTIMTSGDHGATWTVSAPAYSGGSECQAVQLGDGSIMLNLRNEHERFRGVFVTKDLGKSWQPHETNRKTLIEPNCNGSLLRVDTTEAGEKKHALLFSNPHTQKGRTHQTIQVSFDDGRTWPASHHLLLDEGRGAGYSSLTRVDDRHVGIVYEGSQAHLVFERIPLAELLQTGAAPKLVKVFILAGQSNMEGQAVVDLDGKNYNDGKGTLKALMNNPVKSPHFKHLKNDQGAWTVRDDVWVRYQREKQPLLAGPLSIGFSIYGGKHHFGPELQFGHVVGDHIRSQVLLIKTAWGGKSLYKDFRPPSSGGEIGPYYKKMLAEVRQALDHLKTDFPGYKGQGYELAGFVWYHGWNDGVDPKHAVPEYEQNLVHLIQDVRKDLQSPNLPVVIGELTGPWVEAPGAWATLRKAQEKAASRPEFKGNVIFVETHDFVRRPEDSPIPTHGHHEFGNAETCFLVGDALGKGMVKLLNR